MQMKFSFLEPLINLFCFLFQDDLHETPIDRRNFGHFGQFRIGHSPFFASRNLEKIRLGRQHRLCSRPSAEIQTNDDDRLANIRRAPFINFSESSLEFKVFMENKIFRFF